MSLSKNKNFRYEPKFSFDKFDQSVFHHKFSKKKKAHCYVFKLLITDYNQDYGGLPQENPH